MSKSNRLSGVEYVSLSKWIDGNLQDVQAKGMTQEHAASLASSSLGFTVTGSALGRFLRELGKPWKPPAAGGADLAGLAARLDAIEAVLRLNKLMPPAPSSDVPGQGRLIQG